MNTAPTIKRIGHVKCLDGIRGSCALWVLVGHALGVTGPHSNAWGPIAHPQLAVDIFMFISGFLMMSHFHDRHTANPGVPAFSWLKFWTQRLFRIAPLYYAVVAAVIMLRPLLIPAEGTLSESFDYTRLEPGNVLLHLSFISGLMTEGAWSRPIPDWSLSLEMQFYLLFPLLTVPWHRFGPLLTALAASIGCVVLVQAAPGYFTRFEDLPSVLPLKLPLFLSGMLVASSVLARAPKLPLIGLGLLIALIPLPGAGGVPSSLSRLILFIGIVGLIYAETIPQLRWLQPASRLLGGRVSRFMADASFGIYLVHYPLLMLIDATLQKIAPPPTPVARLAELLLLLIPIAYATALAGHRWIEQPGINLGRRLLHHGARLRPQRS